MSNFTFPAGNEGDVVTNTETGDKYIFTNEAWILYRGDIDEFVNTAGDSMTGDLHLPNVDVEQSVFITEGELSADSAEEPEPWVLTLNPVNGGTMNKPYGVSVSPNGNYVYFYGMDGDQKISEDGGETFSTKRAGQGNSNIYTALIQDDGRIFRASANTLWRSTNLGASFSKVTPTINGHNNVITKSASWDDDIIISIANNTWVMTSTDGGDTWADKYQPNGSSKPAAVADDGSKVYILSENGNVSSWDGTDWDTLITLTGDFTASELRGLLYADGVFWLLDKNSMWKGGSSITDTFVPTGPGNGNTNSSYGSHFAKVGDAFVFNQQGEWSSVDEGQTWTLASSINSTNASGGEGFGYNSKYVFISPQTSQNTGALLRSPIPSVESSPQPLYWNGDKIATQSQIQAGVDGLLDMIGDMDSLQSIDMEKFIERTGDSMEGHLTVPDPANLRDAVNARYLQTQTDSLNSSIDLKVDRAGDSMGGPLMLHRQPKESMEAVPKVYVDTTVFDALNGMDSALDSATLRSLFVARTGDTMTGTLTAPDLSARDAVKINDGVLDVITGGDTEFKPLLTPVTNTSTYQQRGVSVSPNGQNIFVYGQDTKMKISKDGGETFGDIYFPTTKCRAGLALDDKLFANNGYETMVSYDLGYNWEQANPERSGHNVETIRYASWDRDLIYVTAYTGWLQVSYDGGENWNPLQRPAVDEGGLSDVNIDLRAFFDDGSKIWFYARDKENYPTITYSLMSWDGTTWDASHRFTGSGDGWDPTNVTNFMLGNGQWWAVVGGKKMFRGGSLLTDPFSPVPGEIPGNNSDIARTFMQVGDAILMDLNADRWISSQDDGATFEICFEAPGAGKYNNGIALLGDTMYLARGTQGVAALQSSPVPDPSVKELFWEGEKLASETKVKAAFEGLLDYLDDADERDRSDFLLRAGDSMTGPLQLPADPTEDLHAVTKQYVDSGIANLTFDSETIHNTIKQIIDSDDLVHVAGDTMTGFLTLHDHPDSDYHAATKAYVDMTIINAVDSATGAITIDSGMIRDTFVATAGDSMSGKLVLPSMKLGGDTSNDGRTILTFRNVADTVEDDELEAVAGDVAIDWDAWIKLPNPGGSYDEWRVKSGLNGRFVRAPRGYFKPGHNTMYSDDGVDWHEPGGITKGTAGIATDGNGTWLLSGGGSSPYVSYDNAETFTEMRKIPEFNMPSPAEDFDPELFEYGNGVWVGIGRLRKELWISDDNGLNWQNKSEYMPERKTFYGLATDGNGRWIATHSGGTVMRSDDDAQTWTSHATVVDNFNMRITQPSAITFAKGRWYSADRNSTKDGGNMLIGENDDDFGLKFTRYGGTVTKSLLYSDIEYGGGNFIATVSDYQSASRKPLYSPDGETWYQLSALEHRKYHQAAYGGKDGTWVLAAEVKNGVADGSSPSSTLGPVLVALPTASSLLWNGDIVATERNLEPLIKVVNDLSDRAAVPVNLNDIQDVTAENPEIGDTLVWNGSYWGAARPTAQVAYQQLAPSNPANGDLWFNTQTSVMSIWHANAWVQIGA